MRVLVLVLTLLLGARAAGAEDKPWFAGVTKDQQKKALALYTEGNGYFEQDLYADALKRFEAALAIWDHPAIRYNAALSSMHLDRTEQAMDHMTQALRFGAAPFTPDIYKEAVNYEKQLGNQLGEVEVTTTAPAEVRLDGKLLLTGPGTVTQRVKIGSHQITATRSGYLDYTRTFDVKARTKAAETVVLKKPAIAARKMQRRWSRWTPVAVIIGGSVVAAAGLPLYLRSQGQFEDFDNQVALDFNDPASPPDAGLSDQAKQLDHDARLSRALTVSAFVVGGVVIVTGVAMLVNNQPRPVGPPVTITPQIGADRAGLVISGSW